MVLRQYHFGSDSTLLKRYNLLKMPLYDEHHRSNLVTLLRVTEYFSGNIWSIKVEHFSGETKA